MQLKNTFKFLSATLALVFISGTLNAQELLPRREGATITEQIERAAFQPSQLVEYEAMNKAKDILDYAFGFRGVPYRYGASSPKGFDCSGFTSFVFKKFGIKLDRTATAQMSNGRKVSRSELKPGDLVFFNGRAINHRIGHVGIVTKVDENGNGFKFIHASVHRGITESHISESYYSRRYMGACRVVD